MEEDLTPEQWLWVNNAIKLTKMGLWPKLEVKIGEFESYGQDGSLGS